MATILRNVRTHEVKEVEPESDEYFDLIAEVFDPGDGTAKPAWEQQGWHSAEPPTESEQAIKSLASAGPETEPHKQLTPGEREAGIKDWDQKEKELGKDAAPAKAALKTPSSKRGRKAAQAPAGRKAEGEKVEANQTQGEPTSSPVS